MAILGLAVAVHAQKFGHIAAELLMQEMPEYDSAQVKFQELNKTYDLELERIQVEINKKIEDFQQNEANMTELIKQAKVSEIQEMQQRLQNFAQTAQQDLQQQQMMLIQPVVEKARQAIEEVAKEQGLIYVFDMSQNNPVYASDESVDLMPLVKAKLGL
jgi:outer membrane protein